MILLIILIVLIIVILLIRPSREKLSNLLSDESIRFIVSESKKPNKKQSEIKKKYKINIITAEDRNGTYIDLHNESFRKYSKMHGYNYVFMGNCPKEQSSTYWCKIHKVKESLNNCDYVLWVDSDTIITNNNFSLDNFINSHSEPDIIVGVDCIHNCKELNKINAGVFLIKNSPIGKKFIDDCLSKLKSMPECIVDNKEQGDWAGICYEQGVMNLLVSSTYRKNTHIDYDTEIVFNSNNNFKVNKLPFILHMCDKSEAHRNKIFNQISSTVNDVNYTLF
jgi:hypothetical protein